MRKILSLALAMVMLCSAFSCLTFTVSAASGKDTIESISYTLAEPIVLIKGFHNPDGGSYDINILDENNHLIINYESGKKVDYVLSYKWADALFFDENDEQPNGRVYVTNEGSEKWDVGKHTVKVFYEDYGSNKVYSTEIQVEVIENPIESISIKLSEPIVFVEGEHCRLYENENGEKYYVYEPCMWDIPIGSVLKIKYKDNSEETYTRVDAWDDDILQYYPAFINAKGKVLSDGEACELSSYEETEPWSKGVNYFDFSVYGVSIKVPATVKCSSDKHVSSSWKIDKQATVYKAGSKHKECTECGEILKTATIAQLKCSKPTMKLIENTEYGVLTKWGKVKGADKYRVYRKTSETDWEYIGSTSKNYYTDKTAKSGTKYYYAVRAINEAGLSSRSSSISKYYLEDPTLNTPSSTSKGVGLKWSKVAGAEGYIIYRKTGSGSYSRLKVEKGVSNLTYRDTTAEKGTKYYYKVKAYKSKTYSAYSNTKTITDKY